MTIEHWDHLIERINFATDFRFRWRKRGKQLKRAHGKRLLAAKINGISTFLFF